MGGLRRSVLNEVFRTENLNSHRDESCSSPKHTNHHYTTLGCRWAWSQRCVDTPTFYSEFSPSRPPCFFFFLIPLSVRVLAAGSTLGDPRGENTLLSPGSQGDCWRIPVYDFAAAAGELKKKKKAGSLSRRRRRKKKVEKCRGKHVSFVPMQQV